jgi:uncharacterized surface protein with fasciclin (FAS1) repeats
MKNHVLSLGLATALVLTGACNKNGAPESAKPQTDAAQKAAGDKTIASGLSADSKFMAAAKSAGLDQTLAGPGPYTVFVPDDAAFNGGAAGAFDTSASNRAQLTGALTNMILPGTVLAADIGKAIDNGKGKAVLATMGGGTLTATKDGNAIVLTDTAGDKVHVTKADEQYSNGVVHHVDGLLLPSKASASAPAVGDKAGK